VPDVDTFFASADAYRRFVGRYSEGLAEALVDFTRVEAGMRALDVGCGPGGLAAVLADRLGQANVAAVDPSEPFVQACRARLPESDVRVAGAEALPFEDDTFDVVLSQLVVNFMDDPERGVREMARVTRRGGSVSSCVWDYGEGMTLLRSFWDAAHEVDPERAAGADESTMRWCAEGELAELWRAAGFENVRFGPLVVRAQYEDFADLWSPFPTGVGPAGAFAKSLDDEQRGVLRDSLRRRLGVGDEPFELSARAWVVAGQKP
jgi:ubiquinone/menaquinone biosynthesis C-methylase UbiE